jgi:hypothetical protein
MSKNDSMLKNPDVISLEEGVKQVLVNSEILIGCGDGFS